MIRQPVIANVKAPKTPSNWWKCCFFINLSSLIIIPTHESKLLEHNYEYKLCKRFFNYYKKDEISSKKVSKFYKKILDKKINRHSLNSLN